MADSIGRTVAAQAQLAEEDIRDWRVAMQGMRYLVNKRRERVSGKLVSYHSQAEQEESSLLRVGELVEVFDAMKNRALRASGRSLYLNGSLWPLEIVARSR
jgi:hypothetical protein